ncbi:hypothetical protein EV193_10215 [Herbihabitans rhizosphaerae]|uniref:MvdD-like pre-ATP grasp domain-containing protein n=1 Tax=Herbihabitans rhizosphaerae TaxID=1872711 RepID=A0A4Q7L0P7_9PSEU|nr:ATP-grasp ribosomal peptide maturase [Herbihabitans rhizosphaerae]RZS43039.1 hypothetical protein EV193_10215 [Herbihabitans rhizosphaerae]
MTVVIFAERADATIDAVVHELRRRDVPVFLADPNWFPDQLVLDAELSDAAWSGWLCTAGQSVVLQDIRSIWCRERTILPVSAELSFNGVLAALDHVLWVNHPIRAADAASRPLQLATAVGSGLQVPATLVTNSPEAARWFTNGTHDLDQVSSTLTEFQDPVETAHEAHIIAIGDHTFTLASHEWIVTPPSVERALRRYMNHLGLTYAAFAFTIDHSGHWWFHSSDADQFDRLNTHPNAPLIDTFTDLLTAADT